MRPGHRGRQTSQRLHSMFYKTLKAAFTIILQFINIIGQVVCFLSHEEMVLLACVNILERDLTSSSQSMLMLGLSLRIGPPDLLPFDPVTPPWLLMLVVWANSARRSSKFLRLSSKSASLCVSRRPVESLSCSTRQASEFTLAWRSCLESPFS